MNHDIRRQLTASYTPQQNGVTERKNRTIMNMVRSMLAGKNVLKEYWPEATIWAVHLINRSPTLAVKKMTPEEAWTGKKPDVQYLRIFGSLAHVHIPKEKRKKLDARSIQCVLFGASEESKAYMLFNPATG